MSCSNMSCLWHLERNKDGECDCKAAVEAAVKEAFKRPSCLPEQVPDLLAQDDFVLGFDYQGHSEQLEPPGQLDYHCTLQPEHSFKGSATREGKTCHFRLTVRIATRSEGSFLIKGMAIRLCCVKPEQTFDMQVGPTPSLGSKFGLLATKVDAEPQLAFPHSSDGDLPLGKIEEQVLGHFLRCVTPQKYEKACVTQEGMDTRDMNGGTPKVTCPSCSWPLPEDLVLHPHSIKAAAGVIAKACTRVVCHLKDSKCGWGCQRMGETPNDDSETWDGLLESLEFSKRAVEWSLWGIAEDNVDSDKLWEAVWECNVESAKGQLERNGPETAETCHMLQQRRRFKVDFNPKILTGSVFLLAVLKYDRALTTKVDANRHREMAELLLEKKADINAMYDLFPAGMQSALVTSPLCYIATKVESLKFLVSKGANLNVRSTINYHLHNNILNEAVWAKDDDRAHMILSLIRLPSGSRGQPDKDIDVEYAGWEALKDSLTIGSKGWHSDHPPLFDGSCSHRFTALARAIELRMGCFDRMLYSVEGMQKHVVKSVITHSLPKVHPNIWNILSNHEGILLQRLSFLLWIPTDTARNMHRTLLEQMWTTLRASRRGLSKLWLEEIWRLRESKEDHDQARKLITMMIHHAPKAATIMLDDFFLQEPKVVQPNRNIVASQAVIDGHTGMNTKLAHTCEWEYPNLPWQQDLTTPAVASSLTLWRRLLPTCLWPNANVSQFCRVRVVHIKGMSHIRIFLAMGRLCRNDQVNLLQECTTLRAVVFYTYNRLKSFRYLSLAESIVQLVLLLMLCTGQDSPVCWMVFSASVLADIVYGAFVYSLYTARVWHHMDKILECERGNRLGLARLTSRRAIFEIMGNLSSVGLIGIHLFGSRAQDGASLIYTVLLCAVLFLKFVNVIDHVSLESILGELLIPIADALQDMKIIGMIFVILLFWIVSVALIYVVQDHFAEADVLLIIRSTWVHFVVGEPVMHDAGGFDESNPESYTFIVNVLHMAFQVALLNTLLATTIQAYSEMSKTFRGRHVRKIMVTCMHWLALRECLHAKSRFLTFAMSPCKARFFAFAILVFGVSILLLAFDSSFEIVPFFTITPVLIFFKIAFLMQSGVTQTLPHPSSATRPEYQLRRFQTGVSPTTSLSQYSTQEQPVTVDNESLTVDKMFLWVCLPDFGTEGSHREGENPPDSMQAMSKAQEGLREDLVAVEHRLSTAQKGLREDLRSVQRDLSTLLERLPPQGSRIQELGPLRR